MALLLFRYVQGHEEVEPKTAAPYYLAHIALPMAVNATVQDRLTYNIASLLGTWANGNPDLLANLPPQISALRVETRAGISFAMRHRIVALDGAGFRSVNKAVGKMPKAAEANDLARCQRAARYLGRWFARTNDVAVISALIGVRP
ncbi:three component ABC system middle component [Cellulosimicrobium funkei]|uniref:three component ABC system middle component n=1 Tax=Cellulosimicrobium funkei TaxID=264251 RepID=UPI003757CC09